MYFFFEKRHTYMYFKVFKSSETAETSVFKYLRYHKGAERIKINIFIGFRWIILSTGTRIQMHGLISKYLK